MATSSKLEEGGDAKGKAAIKDPLAPGISDLPSVRSGNRLSSSSLFDFFSIKPSQWNVSRKASLLLLLHASSSISLTILNKAIALEYPKAFNIIFFQNLATVVLTGIVVFSNLLEVKAFKWDHFSKMMPMTFLYVALLWSSMEGLPSVSVATIVIGRSLIPLLSCLIERTFMGVTFKTSSYAALALIFVGSSIYTLSTNEFRAYGIRYVVLNVILSVVTPLLEKNMVQKVKEEQTPLGLVLYRNAMSLPLLLLLILWKEGSAAGTTELYATSSSFPIILAISCFFSFSIGFSVFMLQTEVTVTTIVTANNWYKLLTLLFSLFVWQQIIPGLGWLGIFTNFAGVFWYSYVQSQK